MIVYSMSKQLLFSDEARRVLLKGVDIVSDAVKVTLGAKGRNVLLDRQFQAPSVTKDGVSVAKDISLKGVENIGASLLQEVSMKTNDEAGDGTTTATVLAQGIYREGLKSVTAGVNPMSIKRGIDKAVKEAVKFITSEAKAISSKEEIAHVASVSANNDKTIGAEIANAMEQVGENGVITVTESQTSETTTEVVEGMSFDRGYISPYFANDKDTLTTDFTDPLILIHDKTISNMNTLLPILEQVIEASKPLVIIAEDVTGDALSVLVANAVRGSLQVVAMKAPEFGDTRREMLEDIALLTGGQVITETMGLRLEGTALHHLGTAQFVKVTKDKTTIINGNSDPSVLEDRVAHIKKRIAEESSSSIREKLQERLARLAGGVAIINVGAPTESELRETKYRVEDALSATRSAVEEGIVPGGGIILVKAIKHLEKVDISALSGEEKVGYDIVKRALQEPIRKIAENSGVDGAVIYNRAYNEKEGVGYNVATGEWVSMFDEGIIDSAKVSRSALQNAASVAGLMLTTECIVADAPKKEKN